MRALAWLGVCTMLLGCGVSGPGLDDDESAGASSPSSSSAGGSGAGAGGAGSGATGGGGSSSGGSGSGATGGGGSGDPNCYSETLEPMADVSDIVSAYGGSGYKDQVIEAMSRRWPSGGYLLEQQKNDSYFAQFSDPNDWAAMVDWFATLVHEETHLFNAYHAQAMGADHSLFFREDLILYLPDDSQSFPRSEIYGEMAAVAQNGIYADTYFTGEQGQRGLNELLDEATCYANEVPALSAFEDYYEGFGVSLRDGSAAFLYFIELYLRVARTDHNAFYLWAQSQQVYVDAVRTLWLRDHFMYQLADQFPNLGIEDGDYRAEAYKPENIAEIAMFVGATFDDSNCLIE